MVHGRAAVDLHGKDARTPAKTQAGNGPENGADPSNKALYVLVSCRRIGLLNSRCLDFRFCVFHGRNRGGGGFDEDEDAYLVPSDWEDDDDDEDWNAGGTSGRRARDLQKNLTAVRPNTNHRCALSLREGLPSVMP